MESNGLLSGTDALDRDKKRLRVINHQLKAKSENPRTSQASCKEAMISNRWGKDEVKDQSQDLIIRVAKLQIK